jgi:hypothetical protein
MTEELTAEEREWFLTRTPPHGPKLMRLYDAALALAESHKAEACTALGREIKVLTALNVALARAEAAEKALRDSDARWVRAYGPSAESALAEATEIVRMVDGAQLQGVFPFLARSARAFLSRTPAPAAKEEPTLLERIEAECESVNGTYSHPDQLEQAVCKAFDNIRELIRASKAGGA